MSYLTRFLVVFSLLVSIVGLRGASAADMAPLAPGRLGVADVGPNCSKIWTCRGDLCQWKRVCWHGCPDRYSCSPLYGAYGPYGGAAYWGAYSYGDLRSYQ
jgi:hypothetical protein